MLTQNAIRFDLTAYSHARCLDGSSGAYYLSPPASFRPAGAGFYIYQEGGGFCSSLDDCLVRSHTALGSSDARWWPESGDLNSSDWGSLRGFDRRAAANPLLHDFHHVYIVYCDGGYMSGDNSTVTVHNGTNLHFRGAQILDAVIDDLLAQHGLLKATDVVLGGCSAGAIATFSHLDYFHSRVRAAAATAGIRSPRVVGFPISGYYMDVAYFTEKKAFSFLQQNMSRVMNAQCMAALPPKDAHKCLVAEVGVRFVETPLFPWQSRYDSDQLNCEFPYPCTSAACAVPYGTRMAASIKRNLLSRTGNGIFLDGCWHHCEMPGDERSDPAHITIDGLTPLQGLHAWYMAGNGTRFQTAPDFPCQDCCPL